MRNKFKIKIILLTFGLIFTIFGTNNYNFFNFQGENDGTIENREGTDLKTPKSSGYWATNFIHVDGNWSYTVGNYSWCSGDGSWDNPYIIENVTINASNSPTGCGIFIDNSKNVYFIIRNCTVYNSIGGILNAGIKLENTDHGILMNNNCSNNGYGGISLRNNCYNNTILGNIANNNHDNGIGVSGNSNENNVIGNTAKDNGQYGIFISIGPSNNNISGNTVSNQFVGIYLYGSGCSNNIVSNNNASYGDIGIVLQYAINTFVLNNTVNYNSKEGIYLWDISINNKISGNTVNYNTGEGIIFDYQCDNNTISNNNLSNNLEYGISFQDQCDDNIIAGNIINDNGLSGINLKEFCDDNTILGNTVNYNIGEGIIFDNQCDNNIVSGNIVNKNTLYGIGLNDSCHDNIISENSVNYNSYGIFLDDNCDNNTISENFIYRNNNGIGSEANCHGNLIFYNYLINNTNSNGYDLGSNDWDNDTIGNYWDDYSGIDADYNGIGDTPYDVSGGAGNKDYYPMMIYNAFFFEHPDDLTYEVGVEGHDIKWVIINPTIHSLAFNVFKDGTSIKTGQIFPMIKNEIVINVDGLDIGVYGFTIEVEDGDGGRFTDGLWVKITNNAPIFTATPTDFSYEVGDMGNNLSWSFSDISTNNPTYTITRNGLLLIIDNPCVSGEVIEFSVDGLEVGSYGYTIEINDGYGETILDSVWVTVNSSSNLNVVQYLHIEIVDQSFTTEEFNIIFSVYNESGQGIDFATIQIWWNGSDASTDIENTGNGLYFISLEPITVAPGDDPILLNLIISAIGYQNKLFETYLAVDPDALEKEVGGGPEGDPLLIIIIAISSIAGGIGIVGVTVIILRRRKLAS
ncbi:MAG: right-handed parallel beta-helix repeat-containing protein [Candidatus Lokiarchaeota archaeon]|nr:right-handed parallel beta-helix repeat-containing protein [Candidatus Lokiarchaeota archaeon]